MDSSYGVELVTDCPGECKDKFESPVKVKNAPDIDTQIAQARHKSPCRGLNAQLMQCPECCETCSHHIIVHNLLQQLKKGYALSTIDEDEVCVADDKEPIWPSRSKLDMATYTHSYHMMHGCAHDSLSDNSF